MDSLMGLYEKKCENSRCRYPDRRHTSKVIFICPPLRVRDTESRSPEVPRSVAHVNTPITNKKYCEECVEV